MIACNTHTQWQYCQVSFVASESTAASNFVVCKLSDRSPSLESGFLYKEYCCRRGFTGALCNRELPVLRSYTSALHGIIVRSPALSRKLHISTSCLCNTYTEESIGHFAPKLPRSISLAFKIARAFVTRRSLMELLPAARWLNLPDPRREALSSARISQRCQRCPIAVAFDDL